MTEDERAKWLEGVGEALVRETGQSSGVTEQPPGDHGQPRVGRLVTTQRETRG
jgi:hypothetical protein